MKGSFNFEFTGLKALDAVISLQNVPFAMNLFDDVVKAFRSFGSDEEVARIVKLVDRTEKRMMFNFTAKEPVLQNFFEQYYNIMTWQEIKREFGSKSFQKKGATSSDTIKAFIRKFFRGKEMSLRDIEVSESLITIRFRSSQDFKSFRLDEKERSRFKRELLKVIGRDVNLIDGDNPDKLAITMKIEAIE